MKDELIKIHAAWRQKVVEHTRAFQEYQASVQDLQSKCLHTDVDTEYAPYERFTICNLCGKEL